VHLRRIEPATAVRSLTNLLHENLWAGFVVESPHDHIAFTQNDRTDPNGNPTTLGDFGADPLVVILVRYFGCLPCQEFVRDLDGSLDRFPEGTRVIAVGG